MGRVVRLIAPLMLVATPMLAQSAPPQGAALDSASFVVMKGQDTVAVERFSARPVPANGTLRIFAASSSRRMFHTIRSWPGMIASSDSCTSTTSSPVSVVVSSGGLSPPVQFWSLLQPAALHT